MFFETAAYAQAAAGAAPQTAMGSLMSFMPIILMVVIFYFLLIRPQQKRQKQHAVMLDALKAGDTVLTNAGMIGTIYSIDGNVMVIDLGSTKVRLTIFRLLQILLLRRINRLWELLLAGY